jgi:hypothetical protein
MLFLKIPVNPYLPSIMLILFTLLLGITVLSFKILLFTCITLILRLLSIEMTFCLMRKIILSSDVIREFLKRFDSSLNKNKYKLFSCFYVVVNKSKHLFINPFLEHIDTENSYGKPTIFFNFNFNFFAYTSKEGWEQEKINQRQISRVFRTISGNFMEATKVFQSQPQAT